MLSLIELVLIASAGMVQTDRQPVWEDPFQGTRYKSLPATAKPLKPGDCDGADFNECTFEVMVDFDADGRSDRAYMANAGKNGIIVVEFADKRKKSLVVASFRDRLQGDSYLSTDPADRRNIVFVQPESSVAEFRMIAGKPKVHWLAD